MARHISRPYATAKRDRGGGTCGGVASNRANFCIQRAVLAGRTRSSSTWLCFPWRYAGKGKGLEIIDRTSKKMGFFFALILSSPLCRRVARLRAHSIEPCYGRYAAFRVFFPFFPVLFLRSIPEAPRAPPSHFPPNKKKALHRRDRPHRQRAPPPTVRLRKAYAPPRRWKSRPPFSFTAFSQKSTGKEEGEERQKEKCLKKLSPKRAR